MTLRHPVSRGARWKRNAFFLTVVYHCCKNHSDSRAFYTLRCNNGGGGGNLAIPLLYPTIHQDVVRDARYQKEHIREKKLEWYSIVKKIVFFLDNGIRTHLRKVPDCFVCPHCDANMNNTLIAPRSRLGPKRLACTCASTAHIEYEWERGDWCEWSRWINPV